VPNCTAADVRRQIQLLFSEGMTELRGLSLTELRDAQTLSWTDEDDSLTPEKRAKPLKFTGKLYLIVRRRC